MAVFQKKINNNVAWAKSDDGREMIITGKGISFKHDSGDIIDDSVIEDYYYSDQTKDHMMDSVLLEINEDVFLLTEEIIQEAKSKLPIVSISVSSLISLADHISHALKVSSENVFDYPENLKWEVKRLYPKEYDFAVDVLFLIEKKFDIRLPKSEITFLTYHFVNLQYGSDVRKRTYELTELLNKSIDIIQYHYQIVLNQHSINYIRFVTHVRHFILRQMNKEYQNEEVVNEDLLNNVRLNYRKSYQATEKIIKMIEVDQSCQISNDERFYSTLHIERVTKNS